MLNDSHDNKNTFNDKIKQENSKFEKIYIVFLARKGFMCKTRFVLWLKYF